MVRVGRLAPLEMADADREEEGSNDPGASAEGVLPEGVGREDREGPKEACAEQEDEGDGLPRRREERSDQLAGEQRERRAELRPAVVVDGRIGEDWGRAEVSARLEAIA